MSTPKMTFKSKGVLKTPLKVFPVNGKFILAVYQGNLSDFDLLVKYRQKDNSIKSGWSRLRTPKHIHWAVDLLIKMNIEKGKTKELVSFLLTYWNDKAKPIKDLNSRNELLEKKIIGELGQEAAEYESLENKGEYSIRFILLMAKLLMFQEKTNYEQAYMFKNLLEALEHGENIFKIVAVATHNRR